LLSRISLQNDLDILSAISPAAEGPTLRVEQDGDLPGGLPKGLGQVLHHFSSIFVKQRVVLHDQEAVVVLHLDGHELE